LSRIKNAALIRRMNGRYFLTALGKIVYEAHTIIGKAINYYWKIMTIESIQASAVGLPKEELSKIIDILIDNHQIKEILTKALFTSENDDNYEQYQQQQQQQQQRQLKLLNLAKL
jgi:hypothetical protein